MGSLSSAYVHGSLSSAAAESGQGRGGTAESDAFNGCPYPPCPREDCPHHGEHTKVQGSGWTPLPRKITCMDEVAYAHASSWRCTGAGKRYAVLFWLALSLVFVDRYRSTSPLPCLPIPTDAGDGSFHSFNSYDSDVLLLLPACIREQYPFQLTDGSGVSSELSDLVMSASAKGHSCSGTQSTIHKMHKLFLACLC